jgi:hypothetical protein
MSVPISNVTRRVVFAASGTGPYAFTFEILAAGDIAVYRDDTLLTLTTDYTVTINANGTGSVTLVAAPTGATQIAIVGNRTIARTTDFVTGGDFFANTLNDELDQQTIFNQQNAEGLQRALQAPQTDPTTINMTLPRKVDRAGKYLGFDANGNPVATAGTSEPASLGTMSSQNANNVSISGGTIAGIVDLAIADGGTGASTAANARTNLGLGTLATQNASAVAITGGTVENVTIGGTTTVAASGITGQVAIANGGTGASSASAARTGLGLAIGTDVAGLATAQSFTAAQRGTYVLLTDGATITPDFALGNMFRVQLGGNRTLANPTNLVEGQSGSIDIYQDNTGSRTLAYQWGWDFIGGTAPTLSIAARSRDKLVYQVDIFRSSTVTITIASPGVISWTAHGLLAGSQVRLTTTGALPTGLAVDTTYFVIPVDANSFQLAATQSGTAINTSGSQSGTHTMTATSITAQLLAAIL